MTRDGQVRVVETGEGKGYGRETRWKGRTGVGGKGERYRGEMEDDGLEGRK